MKPISFEKRIDYVTLKFSTLDSLYECRRIVEKTFPDLKLIYNQYKPTQNLAPDQVGKDRHIKKYFYYYYILM